MYVLLQLICIPQADAGSEKLRLKESEEARGTWVENKEQQSKKKSMEGHTGIFVPIFAMLYTPGLLYSREIITGIDEAWGFIKNRWILYLKHQGLRLTPLLLVVDPLIASTRSRKEGLILTPLWPVLD